LMAGLAAHIRQTNEAGEQVVLLDGDWRRVADAHANTPIPTKLDKFLRWHERQSRYAGDFVELPANVYPLLDAQNQDEVAFLADTLAAKGLLEQRLRGRWHDGLGRALHID